MKDLIYILEGFMSSTGGFLLVIFVGALILMGSKNKPGNKKSGSNGSSSN